jgi:hypothetical protein
MTSVLVQLMSGTEIVHLDHEPDDAELDAIKRRYLAWGEDVVSIRLVADARLSSLIAAHAGKVT